MNHNDHNDDDDDDDDDNDVFECVAGWLLLRLLLHLTVLLRRRTTYDVLSHQHHKPP